MKKIYQLLFLLLGNLPLISHSQQLLSYPGQYTGTGKASAKGSAAFSTLQPSAPLAIPACATRYRLDGLTVLAGNTLGNTITIAGVNFTTLSVGTYLLKNNAFYQNGVAYDAVVKITTIYNPSVVFNGITTTNVCLNAGGGLQLYAQPMADPYLVFKVTIVLHGSATASNPDGTPVSIPNVYYSLTDIDGAALNVLFSDLGGAKTSPEAIGSNLTAAGFDPAAYSTTANSTPSGFTFPGLPSNILYQDFLLYRANSFTPCTTGALNVADTDPTYSVTYGYPNYPVAGVELLFGITGCSDVLFNRGNSLYIDYCNTFQISGNLFNDANGLTDNLVNGSGIQTPSGVQMYVSLINPLTNTVIATTAIQPDGSYLFENVPLGSYRVVLTTSSSGSLSASVPSGWNHTGEHLGATAGSDGSANGVLNVTVNLSTGNATQANFGIEQPPTADPKSQTVPYPTGGIIAQGTINQNVSGTDPEDGPLGNSNTMVITSLPANATMYYNGVAVTTGMQISNFNPSLLSCTNISAGSTSVVFNYTFVDAAGVPGTPATYTLNWTGVLPVSLEQFTSEKSGCNTITLSWRVNNAVNFSHFEVEQSVNGGAYTAVGKIMYSPSQGSYSFTFSGNGNDVLQVRLKETDMNGRYTYSAVILQKLGCGNALYGTYPSPVTNSFHVAGAKPGNQEWLYDADGRLLQRIVVQLPDPLVNMFGYPAGTYLLVLRDKAGELLLSEKISKVR